MKTLVLILLAHVAGIVLLVWLGLSLNITINQYATDYAGVITVISTSFGIYSFAVSILYQRSRLFHFWVNRIKLTFARTHTFWHPSFDLVLAAGADGKAVLEAVWESFRHGRFGAARKIAETPTSLTVILDDIINWVFRVSDGHLHVSLDRKLLVPSHLYDNYKQRFVRTAEELQRVVAPVEMRYGITVSFGDGVPNPYYGFFVNRVPADLLQHFKLTFRPDARSSCRVEAGTDRVSIEGQSYIDLFEALSQVLSLRAAPTGGQT